MMRCLMIISQVGPAKDEEAAGEEEETLEQWRMSKMEKEKWIQVAHLDEYRGKF